MNVTIQSARMRKYFLAAGVIAAALPFVSTTTYAGSCPAGKVAQDAMKPGATEPKGVTDMVLGQVDLSKEAIKLDDHMFRLRRLEVKAGGVVPWHSHGDRPAIIYIVSGSITEYSSNCAVPIEHKAGEVAMESVGLSHWWKNNGKKSVVLLSADILHTQKEDGHTM